MRPGCWGLWAAVKLPLWLKSPSGERQWCGPFSQASNEISPYTRPPWLSSPLLSSPWPRLQAFTLANWPFTAQCLMNVWVSALRVADLHLVCVWGCIIKGSLDTNAWLIYWPETYFWAAMCWWLWYFLSLTANILHYSWRKTHIILSSIKQLSDVSHWYSRHRPRDTNNMNLKSNINWAKTVNDIM